MLIKDVIHPSKGIILTQTSVPCHPPRRSKSKYKFKDILEDIHLLGTKKTNEIEKQVYKNVPAGFCLTSGYHTPWR